MWEGSLKQRGNVLFEVYAVGHSRRRSRRIKQWCLKEAALHKLDEFRQECGLAPETTLMIGIRQHE